MLEVARYKLFDILSKKDSLKRFYDLEELQWNSREELLELQSLKLRSLVHHAYFNTEYYRNLFDTLTIKPSDISQPSDLIRLPILTKKVIKANFEKMKAEHFNSYSPRVRATSGSTGEAFHFVIDRSTHSWIHGYMLLAWTVAGFEFGDKVMTIGSGNAKFGLIRGKVLSFLKNSVDLSSFDFDDTAISTVISKINLVRPGIIYGYSSALALLSKHALDNKSKLFSPKAVVSTAENLLPHNRSRIEEAFQCKVFDQYGVMECGITSFECNLHNGYHIGMTKGILETIDDAGSPVEGIPGRIISTDLDNYAFPILRYDSGDIGVYTKKICSCGRGFELLDSINGRSREFLTAANGKRVHGAIFSYLVRENPWINQYQVYQEKEGYIEIRIITDTPIDQSKVKSIKSFVDNKCGGGMTVNVLQVSDIPLSNNNKRQFIVSTISNI